MYSVLLLAAMTTGESATGLHQKVHSAGPLSQCSTWCSYGAGYGGCYGYGYTGWVGVGGWGHPHASVAAGWGEAYGADAGWGGLYGSYAPAQAGAAGCVAPVTGLHGSFAPHQPGVVTPNGEASLKSPIKTARLVVNLPKGARLFVDDSEIRMPGTSKSFRTPGLPQGEQYFYDLRAEVTRDGRVITEKRRVVLGAGQTVSADFRSLGVATGVAAQLP